TAGGTLGTIDLSWSMAVPSRSYLEIFGENGTALLQTDGLTYKFHTWSEWKTIPNEGNVKDGFARQIRHFIDSILTGKTSVLSNEDGLKSHLLVEAAYKSLKLDQKISLMEPPHDYAAFEIRKARIPKQKSIAPAH